MTGSYLKVSGLSRSPGRVLLATCQPVDRVVEFPVLCNKERGGKKQSGPLFGSLVQALPAPVDVVPESAKAYASIGGYAVSL